MGRNRVSDRVRPMGVRIDEEEKTSQAASPPLPEDLDLSFYRGFYADLSTLSDEGAVSHWREFGEIEKRSPNLTTYLATNPDIASALPESFSPILYRYFNPDLVKTLHYDWEFAIHYLKHGRAEGRKHAFEGDFISQVYDNSVASLEQEVRSQRILYESIDDMLRQNGITSDSFLVDFNVQDYITLHGLQELSNPLRCFRHFVEKGRLELSPISLDHYFDSNFYAEIMPSAPSVPVEAYLHWINIGRNTGAMPNQKLFLKELGLRDLRGMPSGFDPDVYLALNPDLVEQLLNRWEVLRHVIWHGIEEKRAGCPDPAASLDVYLAAGDRLATSNRLAEARRIYEIVLSYDQNNGFALQHYGDCLLRLADYYGASSAYQRIIVLGKGNVWTYLNLAECLLSADRPDKAVDVLRTLHSLIPGDVAIKTKLADVTRTRFEGMAGEALHMVAAGALAAGQSKMLQAARELVAPLGPLAPPRTARGPMRTVAIVADMVLAQCRFYRVEQKIEHLRVAGVSAIVFDHADGLANFAGTLPFVEAVIFYRVPALPPVVRAIEATRRAGLPSFYEIDDLIFDEQYYPDSFKSYGGQISEDVYAGLLTGTGLFRTAMSLCDYALASTPQLADRMRPHVISGQAFLHRNAMSRQHVRASQQPLPTKGDKLAFDKVTRIFYGTGTKAHNEDFESIIAPALDRLIRAHRGCVQVVIMGYLTLPSFLTRHADAITVIEPNWDVNIYWTTLVQMDVNLAVLKSGAIADCKSEIKWMEAGMLGIPSVVSPTATYQQVIEDGVDGLFAETPDDWFRALDILVRDPALRREIGKAAHRKVALNYGPEAASRNIGTILKSVVPAPHTRLRVLIVNVFFPPQAIGGATRVVADNVRDLIEEFGDAFEIEVFTTTEGGTTPYEMCCYDWNGVKVTAITAANDPQVETRPEDPQIAEAFGRYLDHLQPAIIHFHCVQRLTAAICGAAREREIPYIVTVHDGWWISGSQFLLDANCKPCHYNYVNPVQQLTAGGPESLYRMQCLAAHLMAAEKVLAVSESFAEIYRACGFLNVETVENGVSPLPFLPRSPSPDGKVRLAHIGGAAPHKGFNLLKAALLTSQFDNLSLTAIDHSLPSGAATTDIWGATPVQFRSKVPQAHIADFYATIDILIAPSLWQESYGLVVREALQAGCWVIVSDRGALGQNVTNGNGFIVDVSDVTSLRDVLSLVNSSCSRYTGPTESSNQIRNSCEQAQELAALYRQFERETAPAMKPL